MDLFLLNESVFFLNFYIKNIYNIKKNHDSEF